ncbi:MAG: hypothetical protein EOO50_05705 [Flavobacterium sp.]|uniref:DUF6933 domain-containing protein n=1 Tax=Flavobacterium sp. TaxID=239 RepID=UPI001201995A|nr:hypothetical protein [Flavobacterium sp.]RZJ67480.1 MAG: hypothetical protein EOO50_05705 [Flavobacterium sp.]
MTNIYLSKATCKYFDFETIGQISPETAYWHWFAHVFELAGQKHLIIMEEQSLYSVTVFMIEPDFKLCLDSFLVKATRQMLADKFTVAQIKLFEDLQDHTLAYPMPFKGREMTIINHFIRRLEKVYYDTNDPAKVKLYSEKTLNAMPQKTLGFATAAEHFKKQLSRFEPNV